jgi:hypothetical protein
MPGTGGEEGPVAGQLRTALAEMGLSVVRVDDCLTYASLVRCWLRSTLLSSGA